MSCITDRMRYGNRCGPLCFGWEISPTPVRCDHVSCWETQNGPLVRVSGNPETGIRIFRYASGAEHITTTWSIPPQENRLRGAR